MSFSAVRFFSVHCLLTVTMCKWQLTSLGGLSLVLSLPTENRRITMYGLVTMHQTSLSLLLRRGPTTLRIGIIVPNLWRIYGGKISPRPPTKQDGISGCTDLHLWPSAWSHFANRSFIQMRGPSQTLWLVQSQTWSFKSDPRRFPQIILPPSLLPSALLPSSFLLSFLLEHDLYFMD